MIFREATIQDIDDIMDVRFSVVENALNTPGLVTEKDCEEYLTQRGKGWVCEIDRKVVGFSIVDLQEHNIWALFVPPGTGSQGHRQGITPPDDGLVFSSNPRKSVVGYCTGTRAEVFYGKNGWTAVGTVNKGEVKFEMSMEDWKALSLPEHEVKNTLLTQNHTIMSEDKNDPLPNEQPAEPKKPKIPALKKNTVPSFNTKNNRSLSSKFGNSSAKGTAHKGGGMKKGK